MNLRFWTWRIWKPATDEPRKWNCCNELVKPSELAQHVKANHMGRPSN